MLHNLPRALSEICLRSGHRIGAIASVPSTINGDHDDGEPRVEANGMGAGLARSNRSRTTFARMDRCRRRRRRRCYRGSFQDMGTYLTYIHVGRS